MASGIILARLLSPEIFGMVGLPLAFLSILDGVTNTGVWQALIQRKNDLEPCLDSAWTLQVLRGLLLASVTFVSAPVAADFFGNPDLTLLFRVLAFTFLIRGVSSIAMVNLTRTMQFRRLTWFDQLSGIVSSLGKIALVLVMRNVWALVWSSLFSACVRTGASYVFAPRRHRFAWEATVVMTLLKFGKYIWGAGVAYYLITGGDRLVIGRIAGQEELGLYLFALTLAFIPAKYATNIISQVTFPAFSIIQGNPERLRAAFQRVFFWTNLAILPFAGFLFVLGPDLIRWVYGEQWMGSLPLLRILLPAGIASAVSAVTFPVLRAVNRPGLDFRMNLTYLVFAAGLIVPATKTWGVVGAAVVMSLGAVLRALVGFLSLRGAISLRLSHPLGLFCLIGAITLAAAGLTAALRSLLHTAAWWTSCLSLAGGVAAYLTGAGCLFFFRRRGPAQANGNP